MPSGPGSGAGWFAGLLRLNMTSSTGSTGYRGGHLHPATQMLTAGAMSRLVAIFCALMLVLAFGTGTAAHAEQRFDCMPATSQSAGHFDGDRDESPSKSQKGATHHHSGCSGHHFGSPSEIEEPAFADADEALASGAIDAFGPSTDPDSQLRPPIA